MDRSMPDSLYATLAQRTWRALRATAHAHRLRFNTNLDKSAALERLHRELLAGRLRRSFRTLTLLDRAALAALQAAGGTLALHEFVAAFGAIRPYKPMARGCAGPSLAQAGFARRKAVVPRICPYL